MPKAESKTMKVESACLGSVRRKIAVADVAFDSQTGDILVVTSSGHASCAVTSYRITVNGDCDAYTLNISAMAGLYAQCHVSHSDYVISHVRFMAMESEHALMVAAGDSQSSQLELWCQDNDFIPLHKSFTAPGDTKLTQKRWVHKNSVAHASMPLAIATPTFPVKYTGLDPSGKLFQCVAVAYKDGSIKIISKPAFRAVTTTNLDMGFNDLDPAEKRRKLSPHITCMRQTFTGCGLLGFDQFGKSLFECWGLCLHGRCTCTQWSVLFKG